MTVLSRRSVHLLALLFLYRTTAKGEENEPEASPYVLDREWKQLLDADPPVDKELRGATLLQLLEMKLGVKSPAWWQPLVKSVAVGPRSPHMIENDDLVRELSTHWNTENIKAPFTGFTSVLGSVNEKYLELKDGPSTLVLTEQIDWADSENQIEFGRNGISGRLHGQYCFLVPHCPVSGAGAPRTLYCFNIRSGKLTWTANLVDGEIGVYRHLQHGSYTEVTVDKDKVIVWAGSEIAALVQAFKVTDGKPLMRFSTNCDRLMDE